MAAGPPAPYQEIDFAGIDTQVTLNAGAGNDTIIDPGSGNFLILGGDGNDTIVIADTTGAVTADGGEGSDTYVVEAGNLQGSVSILDTGTSGTDAVTVEGTSSADTITQTGSQVVANGGTITLAGAETLTVDGGGGTGDTFSVVGTPSIVPTVVGVSETVIHGTAGSDIIVVSPWGNSGAVAVSLNSSPLGVFSPTGRVVVYGLAGNDDVQTGPAACHDPFGSTAAWAMTG